MEDSGFEPLTQACKASVFPIRLIPHNNGLSREDRTPDLLLPKQAHYQAVLYSDEIWCRLQDSNPPPDDYKSTALPDELNRHILWWKWRDLNSRPTPYEGAALPLCYISFHLLKHTRGGVLWAQSTKLIVMCFSKWIGLRLHPITITLQTL